MAEVRLDVDPRMVTGKKVKSLRRQGLIPAHLYGKGTESLALQASLQTISTLLRTAGRNAIIDLQINGEGEPRPVVLRGVQRNPVTDELLHIDFFQISLSETLRADVALRLIGEAPGVHVHGGVLLQSLDHVTVEALPLNIPSHIDVDVSTLETLDSSIFVRDLDVPPNVELLSDPDQVVAKVEAPRIAAEIEAEAAAAAAAAAEAAPEVTPEAAAAAAAEGAPGAAAEGEKKAD
jgi:large subunit ribosomal protein L25